MFGRVTFRNQNLLKLEDAHCENIVRTLGGDHFANTYREIFIKHGLLYSLLFPRSELNLSDELSTAQLFVSGINTFVHVFL